MVSLGTGDIVEAAVEEVVEVLRVFGGDVVAALAEVEVEEGLAAQAVTAGVEVPGHGLN